MLQWIRLLHHVSMLQIQAGCPLDAAAPDPGVETPCVDMTWVRKARASHRLESGPSECRDSDASEARPVD